MINFLELFSNTTASGGLLLAVKAVLLFTEALYGMFAFVVLRQIDLMSKTFKTDYAGFFKFVALAHFLTVVAVFLLSLILL
ncbi:hypothetical protein HN803_05820 [candidate division WWE3 bacterium]|jgi:hypothetical protein|nr:hypothetical protein [candidate division WWE3 bacterium]MBT7350272.1 hypothetical protein [candidate division WWE3 bacterium]